MSYKTCLLIDDNYIDNFVTRRLLESSKFAEKIVVLQSPEEAIDALRNGEVMPDIIFLDLRMPMMNGFEFLQEYDQLEIKKDDIKVFILSASLDPVDLNKSLSNENIIQFVHKPLTKKILESLS